MRIERISISGYRGFKNFEIRDSNLNGFVIIAGQNGSGKSTILETVAYLLNNNDIGQVVNSDIINGITAKETAKWEVDLSFSESDLLYLVGLVVAKESYFFSQKDVLLKKIKKDLKKMDGKYLCRMRLTLSKKNVQRELYVGKKFESLPKWLDTITRMKVLAYYATPFQNAGTSLGTYLTSQIFNPENFQIIQSDINLLNRQQPTNIILGNLLDNIANLDLWEGKSKDSFKRLEADLVKINDVVDPLELRLDPNELNYSRIRFYVHNKKNGKVYALQFASSGEKQAMIISAFLLFWKKQVFRPVILIDEPDSHLHPEFISKLARLVKEILKGTADSTIILATHSPDFIAENSHNVYQISGDSETIERVGNLSQRVALLSSLGKIPDLSYLIPRVIFVEGSYNKDSGIEDWRLYQMLVDPLISDVKFLPVSVKRGEGGSKGETKYVANFTKIFLEAISVSGKTLKVFPLVDKDKYSDKEGNYIRTPYTCLENVLLMDARAIVLALEKFQTSLKERDIRLSINSLIPKGEDVMTASGKVILHKLYVNLSKKYSSFKKGGGSERAFQVGISENIRVERLPEEVKRFLNGLKNL